MNIFIRDQIIATNYKYKLQLQCWSLLKKSFQVGVKLNRETMNFHMRSNYKLQNTITMLVSPEKVFSGGSGTQPRDNMRSNYKLQLTR